MPKFSAAPAVEHLTSARFREVVGRFASGVTVITSTHDGAPHGGTASAFTSLSDAPPMVLVCLNRSSTTAQAVRAAGTFAVNVLGEDDSPLAARFARKGPDKFAGVAVTPDPLGPPLLDEAIAHLVCRVESIVTGGTHLVFLAAVERAAGRSGPPLAYFRGGFARMLPLPERPDPLDLDALHDAYVARAAIEVGAAAQSVGRVPAEQLAELRGLMDATAAFVAGERFTDVAGYLAANRAFHEHVVGLACSPALLELYRALEVHRLEPLAMDSGTRADPVLIDDHRKLVEAFERADLPAAVRVLQDHATRPRQFRTGGP